MPSFIHSTTGYGDEFLHKRTRIFGALYALTSVGTLAACFAGLAAAKQEAEYVVAVVVGQHRHTPVLYLSLDLCFTSPFFQLTFSLLLFSIIFPLSQYYCFDDNLTTPPINVIISTLCALPTTHPPTHPPIHQSPIINHQSPPLTARRSTTAS